MKKTLLIILEIVGIIFGILGIIKLVADKEMIVGALSLSFGILALIWAVISLNSLSSGTLLRSYVWLYFLGLIALLLFSLWHILIRIFKMKGYMLYPEYLFISLAYISFVIASFKVYKISKEFGFKEQALLIKKKLKKK